MKNTQRLQKTTAFQLTYTYGKDFYYTLADAQERAIKENKPNSEGLLVVSRMISDNYMKVWYGEICYGPEKYKWFERIEVIQ